MTEPGTNSTRGRVVLAATWLYAAFVLGVLAAIRWIGSAWWGVAVLLFTPRWIFLIPLLLLAIASGIRRKPGQWVTQSAVGIVVAGPLMGLSLPLVRLWQSAPPGERVRVATVNVGIGGVRDEDLSRWIKDESIDVICFQETDARKPEFQSFLAPLLAHGWHANRRKTIVSHWPIVEELPPLPENSDTGER